MNKNILVFILLICFCIAIVIGYNVYCNKVIDDISNEFIDIFINEDININENSYFGEIKQELKERKDYIITIDKKLELSPDIVSTIETTEEIGSEYREKSDFLFLDERPIINEVGELKKIGLFDYSNSNFLYLSDIEYSEIGLKEIIFNNTIYTIYRTEYPISYKEIMNSSKYNFYFKSVEKKGSLKIINFVSEDGENEVKILVEFKWLLKPIVSVEGLVL